MKSTSHMALAVAGLAALNTLPSAAMAQDTDEVTVLDTVVLEQSRRGVQTDTANSETVVDLAEIEARQASSMGELLDSIPNVALINGTIPSGSAVNIRGLGGAAGTFGTDGKVAVVVDGVSSGAEEIYRNGSLLMMEPELFKEIKVTRGPGEGFRYNSGAIGGTIEAQTKDASDFLTDGDAFAFRQKLGYETNGKGLLSTSILAFAPNERFDVLAFYGHRTLRDTTDGAGGSRSTPDFSIPAYLLKANYQLSDDSSLTFAYTQSTSPEEDVPYDAFNPSWAGDLVDRTVRDTTSYLAYNFSPVDSDLIDLEARLTFKKEDMHVSSSALDDSLYNVDHQTKTVGLRLENTAVFDTGAVSHTLLTGVEFKSRERAAPLTAGPYAGLNSSSAPGGEDKSVAVYITNEMEIGALTLTPQLRYESQTLISDNNGEMLNICGHRCVDYPAIPDGTEYKSDAWTGALAARYQVNDAFAVFGTAAFNENMAILDDLRSSNVNASEKARTYELGLSYDGADVFVGEDRLQAKLTGFKTHIWDGTTYRGIDTTDLEGVELELNYASPLFYADFAAAKTRGTINGTDAFFNYTPADTLQLTLGKRFMDDQLDIAIEAKHAFAQTRTTGMAFMGTRSATEPSDAWTTYALSVGYTPDHGAFEGTEMRLSVENLFDTEYRPYLTNPDRSAKGRNIKFTLAKTF